MQSQCLCFPKSGTYITDESIELVVIPVLQDISNLPTSADENKKDSWKREEMCAEFSLPEIFQVCIFFVKFIFMYVALTHNIQNSLEISVVWIIFTVIISTLTLLQIPTLEPKLI